MTLHVGATLDRLPGYKYQKALHFAELAFRGPRPRPATLARSRREAPAAMRFALVAPRDTLLDPQGSMRIENLRDGVEWLTRAADALEAVAIVLPTGREVTPGQRDRDRLRAFVDALGRPTGRAIVWAPAGLWEREPAELFARKLGVVLAFDPLEDDAPEGAIGYARVQAAGTRSRISTGMLTTVAEKMLEADFGTSYVAIDSHTSFRDAKNLQALAAGAAYESEDDEDDVGFDDDE